MKSVLKTMFLVGVCGAALAAGFMAAQVLGQAGGSGEPAAWPVFDPAPAAEPAAFGKGSAEARAENAVPTVTLPDFATIFERVSPAVVSINSTRFNDSGAKRDEMFQDPFHWFFGRPGQDQGPQRPIQPRPEESGGTGFFITPDGYLLTNYHVIEDADSVRVRARMNGDTKDYEGKVVGADPATDIALVKIEGTGLPYLPLGSSASVRVGEWAMAIGNPFFYENSVTVGVVSAKGRRLQGLSRDPSLDDYLQTDAAINVGNSGGPLLNLKGEVVGINTAVSRFGQGIGFAIPIDMAKAILPQLRESGRVARGAIGVQVADIASLSAEDREYHGFAGVKGALIQDVAKDEPADRAGIRPGDAIIALDGRSLEGSSDLIGSISSHRPGDSIRLTVLRDGERLTKTVQLGDREELWYQNASAAPGESQPSPGSRAAARIGVTVEELDESNRREYEISPEIGGVVITDVEVRSKAYEKGLRPGMVILEVDRRKVDSVTDYIQALESVEKGDLVGFYLWQGNTRGFVTFRIDD